MKKTLAIILALLMVLTLFAACGSTTTGGSSSAPASSAAPASSKAPDASKAPSASSAAPAASGAATSAAAASKEADSSGQVNTGKYGNSPLDKVGFFDPTFDYSKGKKFKVQYMCAASGPLYDGASIGFAFWCKKMNMDYSPMWSSGGDNDAFLNNLQTFIKQGINAFVFDPDANAYPRIMEITKESKVAWMPFMSAAQNNEDTKKPMVHPYVGFDSYWFGQQMGTKMNEHMTTVWKDVPKDKIAYVSVDYSQYDILHFRTTGAQDAFLKLNPDFKDKFFIADTVTGGPTLDNANTVVTAILSKQTKYTHWLCSVLFDDIAMGASAAFKSMGFTKDTAVVVDIGGTSLQRQWDAGTEDCWQYAMFTPQTIYAEPVIGALYAFMTGQATPETIWPSWVDKSKPISNGYARLQLPSYWMDHATYKKLFKWSDIYAGDNQWPSYPATGITKDTYNARMDIPASYAG